MDMLDKVQIGQLGMSQKDWLVFHHFMSLDPDWLGNFELVDDRAEPCQIVFLNTEDEKAMHIYRRNKERYAHSTIITIGESDAQIKGSFALTRPLSFRKFSKVLKDSVKRATRSQTRGMKVLIVDDSVAVQTHMVQKLRQLYGTELSLEVADSGEAALELMSRWQFDLVFLDVMMPGMDGYRCCKEIKMRHQIPVVMLTGKSSTLNRVRAKMSGCDDFLAKPPKDVALQKVVASHLNHYSIEHQIA